MKNNFKIIIGSPVNYNELVAYIIINGEHVALLNQDAGKENLKIEFFNEPKVESVDFETFLNALIEAKNQLIR